MGFYQDQKITALKARIAELQAALKPFADACDDYKMQAEYVCLDERSPLKVCHLRAARAAYMGEKE